MLIESVVLQQWRWKKFDVLVILGNCLRNEVKEISFQHLTFIIMPESNGLDSWRNACIKVEINVMYLILLVNRLYDTYLLNVVIGMAWIRVKYQIFIAIYMAVLKSIATEISVQ